jgi:hypothetical protein
MKSEYISVKPYDKYEPMEDTTYDDMVLRNYIINAFSWEFALSTTSAISLINKLDLFEILVERYWEEFYDNVVRDKNDK